MRVMLVDDESQVLKGITRMLDSADVEWDMETAGSGLEALEVLAREPVDVLVSDMRMPGMDGAELLHEVSRLYPQTVRIILSGQADKDAVYRAVAPMHQYLSKPCEADILRSTIARACALREVLESAKSHELIGRISTLPSLPTLYQEVVAEIDKSNGTVAAVGEIVGRDLAMTAKILQLANSAMFGLQSTVTTPSQAASLLGMENLKSLVLSTQVFRSFGDQNVAGFSIDALMTHSLRVATIAQKVCRTERLASKVANESFTAGLLHDVGKLILAANAPEDFSLAIDTAKQAAIPEIEVECRVFGLPHDGIGGYLLALWGIPQSIVEAVAFHHQPEQLRGSEMDAPLVIYVANLLANEESGGGGKDEWSRCLGLLEQRGKLERLDVWREAISDHGER